MKIPPKAAFAGIGVVTLASLAFAAPQVQASKTARISHLVLLGSGSNVELEITSTEAVHPQAQVVTSPERLVIDFSGASPAPGVHSIKIGRGVVKDVRVGLFSANPPVTRVVVDLSGPQDYQLFPSARTLIVKLSGNEQSRSSSPRLISANTSVPVVVTAKPSPRVQVEFVNGLLSIHADKATMAEVLYEVHRKTGADIPVPAGAEQDEVFTDIGPAPARDALASLLNGSRFNFVMVGSERDPSQLRSVILTPRGGGASQPADAGPVAPEADVSQSSADPEPPPAPDPAETPAEQPVEADTPPQPQQR